MAALPLYRAHRLEKALGTPARIYYKYEGVSPAGSHKPNTAVPQAYYNAKAGIRKLTTETGAGQWGTALSFACAQFDLECEIWQVRASYDAKPYRKIMMEIFGGTVHPSPSDLTEAGPHDARQRPRLPRLARAWRSARPSRWRPRTPPPTTRWARCSTTCCCTRRSSARRPCSSSPRSARAPTSSSAAPAVARTSVASPSRSCARSSRRGTGPVIRAVEPASCPSLTQGTYAYDFGDVAGLTPMLKMHTLGHDFIPDPIHAGGLRYHGMSPLISHLYEEGLIEAVAKTQKDCFAAGVLFARTEGIVPAPEPTHALAAAVDEAIACIETGEEKVILTALCGHGHLDLPAYDAYLRGDLVDHTWDDTELQEAVAEALTRLPAIPG